MWYRTTSTRVGAFSQQIENQHMFGAFGCCCVVLHYECCNNAPELCSLRPYVSSSRLVPCNLRPYVGSSRSPAQSGHKLFYKPSDQEVLATACVLYNRAERSSAIQCLYHAWRKPRLCVKMTFLHQTGTHLMVCASRCSGAVSSPTSLEQA